VRAVIVIQEAEGVASFGVGRTKAMLMDWSKMGIAVAIVQQQCKCPWRDMVRCCPDGWQVCSKAESRYSPVEGEALGVAGGFKKARHFLEGCLELLVGVDHKPLLGLYSPTKALADIENKRLRILVEKACQYRFTAFHMLGTRNKIADGLSRATVGGPEHMEVDSAYVAGASVQRIGE
jgi:hypothetical protein